MFKPTSTHQNIAALSLRPVAPPDADPVLHNICRIIVLDIGEGRATESGWVEWSLGATVEHC